MDLRDEQIQALRNQLKTSKTSPAELKSMLAFGKNIDVVIKLERLNVNLQLVEYA